MRTRLQTSTSSSTMPFPETENRTTVKEMSRLSVSSLCRHTFRDTASALLSENLSSALMCKLLITCDKLLDRRAHP